MKAYIIIDNFGPVKKAVIDFEKKFQILIGPQASGKSTVCKVAYFCRKIRDYSIQYLMDPELLNTGHPSEALLNLKKYLTKQFMGCFGTTKHMVPFWIRYTFGTNTITINLEGGFVRFSFSRSFSNGLNNIIHEVIDVYRDENFSLLSIKNLLKESGIFRQQITQRIQYLFEDDSDIIYIPAGRSVLATMSEQLQDIPLSSMDLTMQEFITRIRETRQNFNTSLSDVVQNYVKTVKGQINNAAVNLAISKIKSILKADYTSEKEGEKLYYDENRWVKLLYASSGQQESLWVLLPCFLQLLHKQKTFIIIEEPEAHLFPDAQRTMVELISLMMRVTDSIVMLTTHSPYILTSANLLVYAGSIEKQVNKVNLIIDSAVRIPPDDFIGYSINEGVLQDIYDREVHMMDAEYIDQISTSINKDLDKLLEIENA